MGKTKKWVIGLSLLAVFVWGGFYVDISGFRWASFLPAGFWGLTSHQWGIIGSGTIGALLGGGLTIAGVVLTLQHQRNIHEAAIAEGRRNESRRNALSASQTFVRELSEILALDTGKASEDTFLYSRAMLATSQIEVELDHRYLGRALLELLSWYRRCMYSISRVSEVQPTKPEPYVLPNVSLRDMAQRRLIQEMDQIKRGLRSDVLDAITKWFLAESYDDEAHELVRLDIVTQRLVKFDEKARAAGTA
ncbi:hypothetical protein [Arthrobacter woluwensis]|uniref:hypothetical protein n=1 Tax=Arthrobacter woluwensis TaxID=156980 RepID=UPI001AAE9E5D|nr:hypothetical protein [Arthrobacter woluwensis]QTF71257.1 hypothetical protein G8758_03975 [Arthrobacter woluwensis]